MPGWKSKHLPWPLLPTKFLAMNPDFASTYGALNWGLIYLPWGMCKQDSTEPWLGCGVGDVSHGAQSPRKVRLRLQHPLWEFYRETVGCMLQFWAAGMCQFGIESSWSISQSEKGRLSFRVRKDLEQLNREARDCLEKKQKSQKQGVGFCFGSWWTWLVLPP